MKHIPSAIILTFLFLTTGCISLNKKNNNESNQVQRKEIINKIELTEQTRGTNRLITFNENTLGVNLNGNNKTSPFTSSEWKTITQEALLIDLEKISTYESPTTGRHSDAALASTIIITSNGKTYNSATFDSGRPPAQLQALYNKLKEFSHRFTKNAEPEVKTH